MASILPHSAQIRADVSDYLSDVESALAVTSRTLAKSGEFRAVYKITLATDAALSKLSGSVQPKISVGRGIVQRVPILVAAGQIDAALVELRQFTEWSFWLVYFSEHPVEWKHYSKTSEAGFESDTSKPISFSAHREPKHYRNYARERFSKEPSGTALDAISALGVQFNALSGVVHGAPKSIKATLRPAFDPTDEKSLQKFREIYRIVTANACILVAAFCRQNFDKLPAVDRAWFDWLVQPALAKRIRSGPFGLEDAY